MTTTSTGILPDGTIIRSREITELLKKHASKLTFERIGRYKLLLLADLSAPSPTQPDTRNRHRLYITRGGDLVHQVDDNPVVVLSQKGFELLLAHAGLGTQLLRRMAEKTRRVLDDLRKPLALAVEALDEDIAVPAQLAAELTERPDWSRDWS